MAEKMHRPSRAFEKQRTREVRNIKNLERRFTVKINRIRILAMTAATLVAAATFASSATAQGIPAVQGKFTLSSAVGWQGDVLPAGDYTFSMQSASLPAQILLQGPNGPHIIMCSGRSEDRSAQESFLTIVRRGDSTYVREIYLAPLGVHFTYSAPKVPKEVLLALGPATTERVLISVSGK
jgi:hypothetical protein